MSDSAVCVALKARFLSFQSDPAIQNEFGADDQLKGAARLALDVASLTEDTGLMTEAQIVLRWLLDFETEREAEEDQARDEQFSAWGSARQIGRNTNRLIKAIVGMELEDSRWNSLVTAYKEAFPTFRVAPSVYDRLSPKALSRVLRKHIEDLAGSRYSGRVPTAAEIEVLRDEAMLILEANTLRYLEKALPGLDFEPHLPKANAQHN